MVEAETWRGYLPMAIALSRLLDPETASQIGLEARLPHVLENLESAMGNALLPLMHYGVTKDDINDVVELALKRTEAKLAETSFYALCRESSS
jgi:hypothetical protein